MDAQSRTHGVFFVSEKNMDRKKSGKKKIYVVLLIVALIALAFCAWYIVSYVIAGNASDEIEDSGPGENVNTDVHASEVENPVDFEALKEINPDIYAWVCVPGTNISYPVLQREGNDSYYIRRAEDGTHATAGCIFSEDINSKDFSDRVTVLYGHNLRSGEKFAQLNKFSDARFFENTRHIVVYLQDRELIYEIFAATPHSYAHILKNNDMDSASEYYAFFNDLMYRKNVKANYLENYTLDFTGDRVIILSTCLEGNNRQRYLVMGRLVADIPTT